MKLNETKTLNDLASCMGISVNTLKSVLYSRGGVNNKYVQFDIPKKGGGVRKINAPKRSLRNIQKKLAQSINSVFDDKAPFAPVSQAYQKEHGIYSNGLRHRNRKLILNLDLLEYFPSIHFGRVSGFFQKNSKFLLPETVAIAIAQLTCHDGFLAQGSAVSPVISNLISQTFDQHVLQIAKKFHLTYTRYADDLTFSTNDYNFLSHLNTFLSDMDSQTRKDGFNINWSKLRMNGPDVRQTVTGLSVNRKVNVPKEFYRKTRSMALSLYTTGSFEIDNRQYDISNIAKLEGRFSFINDIEHRNNIIYPDHSFEYLAVRPNNKSKSINTRTNTPFRYPVAFSSKEKAYRNFLFYKYLYKNTKPIIVTEGPTDIVYLKSALQHFYGNKPNISYLKMTGITKYFFGNIEGGSALKNISNLYYPKGQQNIDNKMFDYGVKSEYPVILLFDHEMNKKLKKDSPLLDFANHWDKMLPFSSKEEFFSALHDKGFVHLISNLYVAVVSKKGSTKDDLFEIEDLFSEEVRGNVFGLGTFEKKYKGSGRRIDKNDFSLIIRRHRDEDIFNEFQLLFSNVENLYKDFESRRDN